MTRASTSDAGAGTVVISGAGSGIGLAVGKRLTELGWRVVGLDLAWTEGSPTLRHDVDVTDETLVSQTIALIAAEHGPITGAVTSAGIIAVGHSLEVDAATFRRVLEVNVTGTFLVARECARSMSATGGGSIVTISSVSGLLAGPHRVSYSSSKGAVGALTRAMAFDLASVGVRVNAIAPGAVSTPLQATAQPASVTASIRRATPQNRTGEPHEIADVAAFLLGDGASYVTGQTWAVDGGQSIQAGWKLPNE